MAAAWPSAKMNRSNEFIPVTITASMDLPELWGRFSRLSPDDADLASQFRLAPGGEVSLSFVLGGKEFGAVRARLKMSARDRDGYYNYSLTFQDRAQSDAIRSALLGR